MTRIFLAAALAFGAALPAYADLVSVQTDKTVAEAADALQAAVEGAGATVFARVDHQAGAASVDLEMLAAQTLIFGNPKIGTPAMQADLRAALYLPLKVAIIDADGGAVLTYEDPAEMLSDLQVDQGADFVKMMQGALAKLTAKAAE